MDFCIVGSSVIRVGPVAVFIGNIVRDKLFTFGEIRCLLATREVIALRLSPSTGSNDLKQLAVCYRLAHLIFDQNVYLL